MSLHDGAEMFGTAVLRRIRNAKRFCMEGLLQLGGFWQDLETSRKIFARRDRQAAAAPFRVSTQAQTSTRVSHPDGLRMTVRSPAAVSIAASAGRAAFLQGIISGATCPKGPLAQVRAAFGGVAPISANLSDCEENTGPLDWTFVWEVRPATPRCCATPRSSAPERMPVRWLA